MDVDGERSAEGTSVEEDATCPPEDDDTFEYRVVQSINDMFWAPEIARRGGLEAIGGTVWAALAILPDSGPVVVQFNDEVQLAGRSNGQGGLSPGDALTLDNLDFLESIEPVGIDPNAGWALLATLPDQSVVVSFDYRRNRGRATQMLDRADEFLAAAYWCLEGGRVGVAVECLHAAELAVSALMAVGNAGPPRRRNVHSQRLGWLNDHTRLGNAPRDFHLALRQLNEWRPAARYLDEGHGRSPLPEPDAVGPMSHAVAAMLAHARAHAGGVSG